MTGQATFAPIRRTDGYLPVEDYGLIGNGATAALVGRDGSIDWLCVPRFDSPPLLCGLLDARRGGGFQVALEDVAESRQYYETDTGILVTEMRGPSGMIRVTDAMPLHSQTDLSADVAGARDELLRTVEAVQGDVRVRVRLEGMHGTVVEAANGGLRIRSSSHGGATIILRGSRVMSGSDTVFQMRQGDWCGLLLRWGANQLDASLQAASHLLNQTANAWRAWMTQFQYEGPQEKLVRRSAVTLKMMDYFQNGAIVAAPTSSLPETIGGVRNWDYRYAWIRDAALSVYAFNRVGLLREAELFLQWVLETAGIRGHPRVLYTVDRELPQNERTDETLEGYRGSRPVRWGNAAVEQMQHDVYGEILDCAYQWCDRGNTIDEHAWSRMRQLVQAARREWRQPDHGIWETRSPGSPFTYSAGLCHVAFDRAIRIAERFGLEGDLDGWRAEAGEIRRLILDQAWNEDFQAIGATLQGSSLDASVLSLPLRRVIPGDHPKMRATCRAIAERLGVGDGLVYRYDPEDLDDGLPGKEGAFLLCSFWMVDNLVLERRVEEALEMYDSLCGRAGTLGLLSEQIDPSTGAFLGNYPQAFSHVGVIASGIRLGRALRGDERAFAQRL